MDTVFNDKMRVVFTNDPDVVRRRLRARYPESWTKVCVGSSQQIVSISEYLYEEKYSEVMALVNELLRKQGLAMYQRHPKRLEIYVEAAVKKIIERVLKD